MYVRLIESFLLLADDSKFLCRVNINEHSLLNDDIQRIIALSILHGLPLSGVKCCVIYYVGRHKPNHSVNYYINNVPIASVINCADFGI